VPFIKRCYIMPLYRILQKCHHLFLCTANCS
jgi:hypothetical protein